MQTRRQFLTSTGASVAAASHYSLADSSVAPLIFGLMADCQYVDAEPRGHNFYRESPRKLAEAVEEMNQNKVALTFHLGDFIDRDFESFDALEPIVANLDADLFHALGNHDYAVKPELKEQVPAKLGLDRNYYSFSRQGCRFIVIDTTELSLYSHRVGTDGYRAAKAELQKLIEPGGPSEHADDRIRYSSRPGDEQVAWIEKELIATQAAGEIALILGHHPVLPDNALSLWRPALFDTLFQKHRCAKAYINGHNHSGAYTDSHGFHYLTLDGMLSTETINAFAVAKLFPDRLEISGNGRQESHTLKFREPV